MLSADTWNHCDRRRWVTSWTLGPHDKPFWLPVRGTHSKDHSEAIRPLYTVWLLTNGCYSRCSEQATSLRQMKQVATVITATVSIAAPNAPGACYLLRLAGTYIVQWVSDTCLPTVSVLVGDQGPIIKACRERKCADTIGTVTIPWTGHFQC